MQQQSCILVGVDQWFALVFSDDHQTMMFDPFRAQDVASFIVSKRSGLIVAFEFYELETVGRSHIILELQSVGLLLGYIFRLGIVKVDYRSEVTLRSKNSS